MSASPTIAAPTPAQDAAAFAAHQAQVARRRAARGYPEVGWNFEEAQPPSNEYVTRDSYLLITAMPTTALSTLNVCARILLPDGHINICQWAIPLPTANTKVQVVEPLVEGFLLSLTVGITPTSGIISRGDTFCTVGMQYGPAAGVNVYRVLVSDYITTARTVSWPECPLNDNLSGPGFLQSLHLTNPAAGADWVYTIPANTRAWIHGVSCLLTTSATAANRLVDFQVKDAAANVDWLFGSQLAQVASLAYQYNASECVLASSVVSVTMLVTLPTEMYLGPGFTIGSSTANIQGGDQWSAIVLLLETWDLF